MNCRKVAIELRVIRNHKLLDSFPVITWKANRGTHIAASSAITSRAELVKLSSMAMAVISQAGIDRSPARRGTLPFALPQLQPRPAIVRTRCQWFPAMKVTLLRTSPSVFFFLLAVLQATLTAGKVINISSTVYDETDRRPRRNQQRINSVAQTLQQVETYLIKTRHHLDHQNTVDTFAAQGPGGAG